MKPYFHMFSSVAQSCPTLCNPMNCSMPGFSVHHQLLELAQTHVHRVNDAIQPSHPLSAPSPPAFTASGSFPFSQFFTSGGQNIGVSASASVLPMNIQDWFPLGWTGLISCSPRDSQEPSPTSQFKSINQALGFPGSSVGKESTCNVGDPGLIPGSGRFAAEGIAYTFQYSWASLVAQLVKNLPAMWETWVRSLGFYNQASS